jgi:catechol 2,3-dioxygenase
MKDGDGSRQRAAIDPRVDIGHVHLRSSDIDRARSFYVGVLGFDVVAEGREIFNPNWHSAGDLLFLSAGGYHHHLGFNTWLSAGGPPQPDGVAGLHDLTLRYATPAALDDALRRVQSAGLPVVASERLPDGEAALVEDPDGHRVSLFAAADRPGTSVTSEPAARPQGSVEAIARAPQPIDPRTRVDAAHLRTADVERVKRFYVDVLGFRVLSDERGVRDPLSGATGDVLRLSADGVQQRLAFNTWHSAGGPPQPDGVAGLHHVAIRYPTRATLLDAVRRLRAAGWPEPPAATDSAIHLAVYYDDPDGNTIELHHDHPVARWPRGGWRALGDRGAARKVALDELVAGMT